MASKQSVQCNAHQLEAAVQYLRKPYMDHKGYGKDLEYLLRQIIIKKQFLKRPFTGELTRADKAELSKIFGIFDARHGLIMHIIKG